MQEWFTIPQDARAWSDADSAHKMGWLRAGSSVRIVELYNDWARFDAVRGPHDLIPFGGGYNERWLRRSNLGISVVEPDPEDVPQTDDAALGAAFRLIVNFVLGR